MQEIAPREPASARGPLIASHDASVNRELLLQHDVFTVSLMGGPGYGKTSLLEETARQLRAEMRIAAVVANPTAHRDAQRIAPLCAVHEIPGSEMSAARLRAEIEQMNLDEVDLLLLEHIAADDWGVEADLGQDSVVAMFCSTAGDDKAAEFPNQIAHADLVLLTKTDLLPHVKFDRDVFLRDVRRANPYVEVIEVSPVNGEGIDHWTAWLRSHIRQRRILRGVESEEGHSEWYFG